MASRYRQAETKLKNFFRRRTVQSLTPHQLNTLWDSLHDLNPDAWPCYHPGDATTLKAESNSKRLLIAWVRKNIAGAEEVGVKLQAKILLEAAEELRQVQAANDTLQDDEHDDDGTAGSMEDDSSFVRVDKMQLCDAHHGEEATVEKEISGKGAVRRSSVSSQSLSAGDGRRREKTKHSSARHQQVEVEVDVEAKAKEIEQMRRRILDLLQRASEPQQQKLSPETTAFKHESEAEDEGNDVTVTGQHAAAACKAEDDVKQEEKGLTGDVPVVARPSSAMASLLSLPPTIPPAACEITLPSLPPTKPATHEPSSPSIPPTTPPVTSEPSHMPNPATPQPSHAANSTAIVPQSLRQIVLPHEEVLGLDAALVPIFNAAAKAFMEVHPSPASSPPSPIHSHPLIPTLAHLAHARGLLLQAAASTTTGPAHTSPLLPGPHQHYHHRRPLMDLFLPLQSALDALRGGLNAGGNHSLEETGEWLQRATDVVIGEIAWAARQEGEEEEVAASREYDPSVPGAAGKAEEAVDEGQGSAAQVE
ncbi:hypothetical protein BAUCODRAFT_127437 [Baudoinia panamericana UAMH 10762]|uniref:Uncharacterized protein n=1 Tax=Baudoinia panamericana (strain UAMH 10762) TaxID=717646 RepID=M2MXE3_BAUPA|nr:uncharacterized protein BAUCODRAFT_127437 [Baudoinia panamericana UAMH 10762]EMC90925.1 hypothetical protein BAUCODRAFT_127437 [Baudoinia panamericana UAMH 10762]